MAQAVCCVNAAHMVSYCSPQSSAGHRDTFLVAFAVLHVEVAKWHMHCADLTLPYRRGRRSTIAECCFGVGVHLNWLEV